MKKIILLATVSIFFFANLNVSEAHRFHRYNSAITFDYFYVSLSPYGEWIEIDYDVYAWHPYDVPYDWQPYSIGRWAWTEYGWYWESYEPFGWATYHYGRWFYDDYYGWLWIPGYRWAPAWVEWRYNDIYIGWAPLSPYARFDFNFGIRFSVNWRTPYRHWHFVRYRNFCRPNINIYIENNNYGIYRRTKYRTNYFADNGRIINRGIDRNFIERRGNFRIRETKLRKVESLRSYRKREIKGTNEIRVFRPAEREVKSIRRTGRIKIRKSERKINLRTNKLALRTKSENRAGIIKKRKRKSDLNSGTFSLRKRTKRNYNAGDLSKYERKGMVRKNNEKRIKNIRKSVPRKVKKRNIVKERTRKISVNPSRVLPEDKREVKKKKTVIKKQNLR